APLHALDRYRERDVDLVVGRVDGRVGSEALTRLIADALRLGGGVVVALARGTEHVFSERLFCAPCGHGYDVLDPRLFSFNSRQGACPTCRGLGVTSELDPDLVVPDPDLSLRAGALQALRELRLTKDERRLFTTLKRAAVP